MGQTTETIMEEKKRRKIHTSYIYTRSNDIFLEHNSMKLGATSRNAPSRREKTASPPREANEVKGRSLIDRRLIKTN